jgi:hypothetical protein
VRRSFISGLAVRKMQHFALPKRILSHHMRRHGIHRQSVHAVHPRIVSCLLKPPTQPLFSSACFCLHFLHVLASLIRILDGSTSSMTTMRVLPGRCGAGEYRAGCAASEDSTCRNCTTSNVACPSGHYRTVCDGTSAVDSVCVPCTLGGCAAGEWRDASTCTTHSDAICR